MKNAASFNNYPLFYNDPLLFVISNVVTCPGVPWWNLQCAIRVPQISF